MVKEEYNCMAVIAMGHTRRLTDVDNFEQVLLEDGNPNLSPPKSISMETVENDCEIENKLVEGLRRMKHVSNEDDPSEDCSKDPCTCGRDHFVLEALKLIAGKYE